jgi:hypothetical protein
MFIPKKMQTLIDTKDGAIGWRGQLCESSAGPPNGKAISVACSVLRAICKRNILVSDG